MYKIDPVHKTLTGLNTKTFRELGFWERFDLQEWLVHSPEVLGEELLIIQKEYRGFAYTDERLDLLALDKNGQLVVIENKTDDTGRDLVWQSLKYAAYCSALGKSEIIKLYQEYLDVHQPDECAEDNIAEFLEGLDIDEI